MFFVATNLISRFWIVLICPTLPKIVKDRPREEVLLALVEQDTWWFCIFVHVFVCSPSLLDIFWNVVLGGTCELHPIEFTYQSFSTTCSKILQYFKMISCHVSVLIAVFYDQRYRPVNSDSYGNPWISDMIDLHGGFCPYVPCFIRQLVPKCSIWCGIWL